MLSRSRVSRFTRVCTEWTQLSEQLVSGTSGFAYTFVSSQLSVSGMIFFMNSFSLANGVLFTTGIAVSNSPRN